MPSRLRTRLQNRVKRALAAKGYQLQRLKPLDVRDSLESPRDLLLKNATVLRWSLLVNVPVSRFRSSIGVALDEQHPFVATLAEGPSETYEGSLLEAYYQRCQPGSAIEVLGVPTEMAPGFTGLPPAAFVMPWHSSEPNSILRDRGIWMKADGAQYGRQLTIDDGLGEFGPVTRDKGVMEVERLSSLYDSISRLGFQRPVRGGKDINGWLLTEERGNWCIVVRGGQHRVSVAAVLGCSSVPVSLQDAPIKREEVMYWPQVVAGRITREGALAVFDRIMRGNPPPACRLPR